MNKPCLSITLSFLYLITFIFTGCVSRNKLSIEADYHEGHTIKDYFYLGLKYHEQGEYDRAVREYSRAIMNSPDFALAYYHRAAAYSQKSQYDMAASDYSQAIKIDPKFAEGFYNQGTISSEKGKIKIHPKLAEAFYNRGNTHHGNGNYDMAISDYSKAIKINQDDARAYNKKAWILATCADERFRDCDEAVTLAKKAVYMSPKPFYMDTLGAAYAEAGKFENAIATQEQVIAKIKKINTDENLIDECMERLKFYKAKRPWREIR